MSDNPNFTYDAIDWATSEPWNARTETGDAIPLRVRCNGGERLKVLQGDEVSEWELPDICGVVEAYFIDGKLRIEVREQDGAITKAWRIA